ncbi:hypothetical protein DFR50_114143 [Roseiarcus fermentans]|uniref:Addiction module component n=1 Tax=Roseiarcus fermentans TaxID=1473586 RepID=A0A366FCA5_9HYPH|nr:hypothetical protein [Roseiarcus fermentans]RBP12313.1 hypothetical protein DFR50_114143 [Roseiarcus fermentans]
MTELLDHAVRTVLTLSPATQDALARILLELAGDDPAPITLDAEENASFDASFTEAERGAFATDDEVRAIWARRGR